MNAAQSQFYRVELHSILVRMGTGQPGFTLMPQRRGAAPDAARRSAKWQRIVVLPSESADVAAPRRTDFGAGRR
jgi:hypothetical protein